MTVSRGAPQPGHAYDDGTRRAEVLETAASLIATSGLRISMHDIADAAGIQTGSLYHHFDSRKHFWSSSAATTMTLIVADRASATLTTPPHGQGFAQIAALGTAIAQCGGASRCDADLHVRTPSSNPDLITWTQRRPGAVLRRCTRPCAPGGGAATSDRTLTSVSSPTGSLGRCCKSVSMSSTQRRNGSGRDIAVPDHDGRAWQPVDRRIRSWVSPPRSLPPTGPSGVGPTRLSPTIKPPTSERSRERSSVAADTRAPPCAISRRPPESATAPYSG